MKAGDIMIIPPNVPRKFRFLEDSIDIEIFAPGAKTGSMGRRLISIKNEPLTAWPRVMGVVLRGVASVACLTTDPQPGNTHARDHPGARWIHLHTGSIAFPLPRTNGTHSRFAA
jgi:hypothetical protein